MNQTGASKKNFFEWVIRLSMGLSEIQCRSRKVEQGLGLMGLLEGFSKGGPVWAPLRAPLKVSCCNREE